MRVAGACKVLGSCAEFHRNADFMDQVTGHGTDDVRAEDAVGFLVRKDFDKAICREVRLGTTVAHERELADLIGAAFLFQLLFGLADVGYLGVCVDHARDDVVVHVTSLTGDGFSHSHAFVFGLVGKHGTRDGVTDCVDAFDVGRPVRIGFDLTALGHLDTNVTKTETISKRFAARGDENRIGFDRLFLVVLFQFVGDFRLGLGGGHALNGCPHDEL